MKQKNERITAWVTKYALTTGIIEVEGEICNSISSDMFTWESGDQHWHHAAHGKDWHKTRDAALSRAEDMRKAKVASLQKRIDRLKALRFE